MHGLPYTGLHMVFLAAIAEVNCSFSAWWVLTTVAGCSPLETFLQRADKYGYRDAWAQLFQAATKGVKANDSCCLTQSTCCIRYSHLSNLNSTPFVHAHTTYNCLSGPLPSVTVTLRCEFVIRTCGCLLLVIREWVLIHYTQWHLLHPTSWYTLFK